MTDGADRLTKVEILLGMVVENQEGSKERQHKLANEVMVLSHGQTEMRREINEALAVVPRVTSLEASRSTVLTGLQILKWMAWIIGGFFTLSLAIGEKLANIWKALAL